MKLTKYGRVLSNFFTPNFQKNRHQLLLLQKKKRATHPCNSSIPLPYSPSLNFIFNYHSSSPKASLLTSPTSSSQTQTPSYTTSSQHLPKPPQAHSPQSYGPPHATLDTSYTSPFSPLPSH